MGEQAPAGWYPDGSGNERYWDGSAWTDQVRGPGGTDAVTAAGPGAKKEGAFAKLRKAAAGMQAEMRSEKEEIARKQAEDAEAAGALVTSGVFGTSTVEIYAAGYVRVSEAMSNGSIVMPITKKTPFERLNSIKYTQPGQDDTPGVASALEGAVGPAVARLARGGSGFMKVGTGFMKASAPGLAVAGLAHLAGVEGRKAFLTIVTDKSIHTLSNQSGSGLTTKINKGHNEVGLALEAAGNSVLGVVDVAGQHVGVVPPRASESQPALVSAPAAEPTLAGRLRELADLHKDGILTDDEFAAAKAKLLGGL